MGMLTVISSILILFTLRGNFTSETVQNKVSVIFEIQEAWIFPGLAAIVFEVVIGLWLMIKGVKIYLNQ